MNIEGLNNIQKVLNDLGLKSRSCALLFLDEKGQFRCTINASVYDLTFLSKCLDNMITKIIENPMNVAPHQPSQPQQSQSTAAATLVPATPIR